MKYLIILIALTMVACKKDDKTIGGTYVVTVSDGVHLDNGTLVIGGNELDINVTNWATLKDVKFDVNGTTITFPQQSLGGSGNLTITEGTGSITDQSIAFRLIVDRWGSPAGYIQVNGSK